MALPSIGGGQQIGDGNLNEIQLNYTAAPPTATATATLTVAQITNNILVGNPSTTAAAYTLPTGTLLDAALANVKVGSTFELTVVNLGTTSGVITMTAGTGWTLVGVATIAVTSSRRYIARRTGTATWTLYTAS